MVDTVYVPTDLETRLVAAARALLDEAGADAVSVREVARRCGVSHGAPRRHFPALALLLARLAGDVADELGAALAAAGARPRPMADAYVGYAVAHPHAFDLMTRHDLVAGSGFGLRAHTLPLLAAWTAACREHRGLDGPDAVALWAAVHGVATLAARTALDVPGVSAASLLDRLLR